jgi:hypothetical protein
VPRASVENAAQEVVTAALQIKKVVYGLLLRASETLLEVAHNPAYLGAEIGFFSVLHTSNQKLQAIKEFQSVIQHQGLGAVAPERVLAYVQLGRAYAAAHDVEKSKALYKLFFELWKDADPDIPILMQARAEYSNGIDTELLRNQAKTPLNFKRIDFHKVTRGAE